MSDALAQLVGRVVPRRKDLRGWRGRACPCVYAAKRHGWNEPRRSTGVCPSGRAGGRIAGARGSTPFEAPLIEAAVDVGFETLRGIETEGLAAVEGDE